MLFSYITSTSSPINAFQEFFLTVLRTIFFLSHWLLSHMTIVETIDCDEKGMHPVAMNIINPRRKILAEPGIEPATSVRGVN